MNASDAATSPCKLFVIFRGSSSWVFCTLARSVDAGARYDDRQREANDCYTDAMVACAP